MAMANVFHGHEKRAKCVYFLIFNSKLKAGTL